MNTEIKPKILIVDDLPDNLHFLEKILEKNLDCAIFKASSGQEAVNITIESDGFDLILLDIEMPDMNGYRVAEILKEDQRFRTIPVIFVTGSHKDERDVDRGFEVGAMDYLIKPVSPHILLKKIQNLLALDMVKK